MRKQFFIPLCMRAPDQYQNLNHQYSEYRLGNSAQTSPPSCDAPVAIRHVFPSDFLHLTSSQPYFSLYSFVGKRKREWMWLEVSCYSNTGAQVANHAAQSLWRWPACYSMQCLVTCHLFSLPSLQGKKKGRDADWETSSCEHSHGKQTSLSPHLFFSPLASVGKGKEDLIERQR